MPDSFDKICKDWDKINNLSGHVTRRGLVEHDVQHAQRVVDDRKPVVVNDEQAIVVGVHQDFQHLK